MSYWDDKRVLVTGGGGFLGNHVVEKLKESGCEDIYIARSRDYDLTSQVDAARLFDEHPCEIVFHLAGLVGGIGANKAYPADYFYQNLMMGVNTIDQAWKHKAQKVIAAGAGCGYPEHAPIPLKEDDFWNGFPQHESAPYSLAKRMLHVQSMAYWRQYEFPVIVGIPGNIYGPYDNFDLENAHVIPALVRKFVEAVDDDKPDVEVWGTGKSSRDFVYAGDVASGLIKAVEVYNDSQLVNISAGKDTTILDVVETLIKITGFKGEIAWDKDRPEGQIRRLQDMTKADKELGFSAPTGLEEGLKITIDWYRENRDSARNIEPVKTA